MAMRVRTAAIVDRNRCIELLGMLAERTGGSTHPSAPGAFDALLDEKRGQILVAEQDGVVLGLAAVSYNLAMRFGGEYCQLEELIVDPSARGKNVGGLLMEETLTRAKRRGCAAYGLYLVQSTEGNRAFYEKYGFEVVGSEMRQVLTPNAGSSGP